jgi:hypothetical protein
MPEGLAHVWLGDHSIDDSPNAHCRKGETEPWSEICQSFRLKNQLTKQRVNRILETPDQDRIEL